MEKPSPPGRGRNRPAAPPPRLFPYLCGVGAILCWASLAAAIGEGLRTLAPEAVLFHGLLAAGVGLNLWRFFKTRRLLPAWPGARIALLGLFGIWGYHTLLVLAFSMAPLVEANILNYAWPLWILLLGALLPGHRLSRSMAVAGLLGFAGVVLVLGGGALPFLSTGAGGAAAVAGKADSVAGGRTGFAVALAAGVCWASFTVLTRRLVPPEQKNMPLYCLLSVAPAGLLLVLRDVPFAISLADVPVLLYFGLVPLGLSFVLWERAVQGCNVQVLGLLSFFTPALSTLLLALVSGAAVPPPALGGLALITGGSLLGWLGSRNRAS